MRPLPIVIDANVIISAMRSRRGASFRLLSLIGDPRFVPAISPPLIFEYEAVAFRPEAGVPLAAQAINDILDRIWGRKSEIFFKWRPQLRDAGDEFVPRTCSCRGV